MNNKMNIEQGMGLIHPDFIAPFLWYRSEHLKENGIYRYIGSINVCLSSTNIIKTFESLANYKITIDDRSQLPAHLQKAAKQLQQLAGCTGCRIYTVNKEKKFVEGFTLTGDACRSWTWTDDHTSTFAIKVAQTNIPLLINSDVYNDERFPDHTGWPEDHNLTAVMCLPVQSNDDDCKAVIEFTYSESGCFEQQDMKILTSVCGWLSSNIQQFELGKVAVHAEVQNTRIQQLMNDYMAGRQSFDDAINDFLRMLKTAISADTMIFYLMDPSANDTSCSVYEEATYELPNRFIQKKLKTTLTGLPLLAHTKLDSVNTVTKPPGQERRSNVATISILCYPIKRSGRCEAVLLATNKLLLADGGSVFTTQHVQLIATVFERCCSNMAEHKKQCDLTRLLTATNHIYGDFMMNRMKIRNISHPLLVPFEPTKLTEIPNISSFSWHPESMSGDELIGLCYSMIMEVCDCVPMEPGHLFLYVITIHKMHRDLPSHNFEHSFSCLHNLYCILKRYDDRFDEIEKLAMMLGALGRNIEHTGYSNSWLRFTNHPLSIVHDTGSLQNEQFRVSKLLINNTQLISQFSDEQQERFMHFFRLFILTPELQYHLRFSRVQLEKICVPDPISGRCSFDWEDEGHRELLHGLISVVGNLAINCKPYRVTIRLADRYMRELFAEGDDIRRLGCTPVPHMDRLVSWRTPEWHIRMMRFFQPVFELLHNVMPQTSELYEISEFVCQGYLSVIETRGQSVWAPEDSWSR